MSDGMIQEHLSEAGEAVFEAGASEAIAIDGSVTSQAAFLNGSQIRLEMPHEKKNRQIVQCDSLWCASFVLEDQ